MRLSTADILKLVPEFMRDDAAVKGLAAAVNDLIRTPGAQVKTARVWDQIDNLSDEQLDELAYELDIDWYSSSLPIENKRAVVKISDLIHSRRGTRWAVEQLITAYIAPGEVVEWFEEWYADAPLPFHFSVSTSNRNVTDETLSDFKAVAQVAKSVRSRLDSVYFSDKYGSVVIASPAAIAAYFFTPTKCGTVPRIATIGVIPQDLGVEASGQLSSFAFESEKAGTDVAGTLPRAGTIGRVLNSPAQVSSSSSTKGFTTIQCGTMKCGE